MLTLGIHDGHTATACVVENGRVLAAVSEERLNRRKEWEGFPENSIRKCMEIAGLGPESFDAVGVCSLMTQIGQDGYRRPGAAKRLFGQFARVAPSGLLQRESNIGMVQAAGRLISGNRKSSYRRKLAEMGFTCPHRFYEHHRLHAVTAYYTNWNRPDPCLVITLDGSGDGVAGTVQVGSKGRLKRISGIFNYNSICEFYTKITQHLGMKPMSHEYKVMGMAPYASGAQRAELLEVFRRLYRIPGSDPLQIQNTSGKWKWQLLDLFRDLLAGRRFDNICGAAQDLFEEIVQQWIQNAVAATGIRDLALSGGGFMNVKLNGKILESPEVGSLFVFPSCGDESNPVGAALQAALDMGFDYRDIGPVETVYWGPAYSSDDVESAVLRLLPAEGFRVTRREDIDRHVGKEAAAGKIIGRMTGRMEWGARALGNRSIVADPRSQRVVHRINRAIKMRDFWMPFAPAVLEEDRERYLKLKEDFRCPFMVMGCDTTEEALRDIPAAIHPFDNTARPQVVDAKLHSGFHRLIESFREETGVGAVLNTSFNIHGDPMVCGPGDAVHTFLNSRLDALQMEDYYIERPGDAR